MMCLWIFFLLKFCPLGTLPLELAFILIKLFLSKQSFISLAVRAKREKPDFTHPTPENSNRGIGKRLHALNDQTGGRLQTLTDKASDSLMQPSVFDQAYPLSHEGSDSANSVWGFFVAQSCQPKWNLLEWPRQTLFIYTSEVSWAFNVIYVPATRGMKGNMERGRRSRCLDTKRCRLFDYVLSESVILIRNM